MEPDHQILQVMPRVSFARLVHKCGAERQGIFLLGPIRCHAVLPTGSGQEPSGDQRRPVTCGKLSHLGLRNAPARSTLSYANTNRPWELYQNVFFHLRNLFRSQSPGKKREFRFRNKLLSLDSTTIDLCLSLFPWAEFRQVKGSFDPNMLLDHDGYIPDSAVITDGKTHDVIAARHFTLPTSSIVAVDRGYYDFDQSPSL